MTTRPTDEEIRVSKFRKKPVVIEAIQWTGENSDNGKKEG